MNRRSIVPRPLALCAALVPLLISWPAPARAQPQAPKLAIHVTHEGPDRIGRALAYTLREEVRKSAGYELVQAPEGAAVAVRLASVDAVPGGSAERASAVSVVHTRWGGPSGPDQIFVASEILLVGGGELELAARSVLARVEERSSGTLASWSRAVADAPALCDARSGNPFLSYACRRGPSATGYSAQLAGTGGGYAMASRMAAPEEAPPYEMPPEEVSLEDSLLEEVPLEEPLPASHSGAPEPEPGQLAPAPRPSDGQQAEGGFRVLVSRGWLAGEDATLRGPRIFF